MKLFSKAMLILALMFLCHGTYARSDGYDVFVPIGKYLAQGNAEALSAWFADNMGISVLSRENTASRSQARQIVKSFFETYSPRSFSVSHTAGQAKMKYALGVLTAGGEKFSVTIFVNCKNGTYRIQQLRIQRM